MENEVVNVILKELREFRNESEKRFDALEKGRIEDREYLEKCRVEDREELKAYIEQGRKEDREYLEACRKEDREYLEACRKEDREYVDDCRKKDRRDILDVLDTMQKSISNQFESLDKKMMGYVNEIKSVCCIHEKILGIHDTRIDFQNSRINNLEEWKNKFDDNQIYVM